MTVSLAVAAILPALLLVWYVVRRDLYPEPPAVLVGTFLLGALAVIPAGAVVLALRGPLLGGIESAPVAALTLSFVLIAPAEEALKLAVLAGFAGRRRVFNEPMDGLVYGGVAGLGFATAENVAYVAEGGLDLAFLRAITAVPMHASVGVVMGFFYALARYVPDRRLVFLAAALVVPIGLHGAYNFPLILQDIYAAAGRPSSPWLTMAALAVLAFMVGLALARLRRIRQGQRAGHHESAADGRFHEVGRPYQRLSTARHVKGPAAVVIGGSLVWGAGTGLLSLLAGLAAGLVDAHPESPAARAHEAAETVFHGLGTGSRAMVLLLLVLLTAFGAWLFGRGILWLNRRDAAEPRTGQAV